MKPKRETPHSYDVMPGMLKALQNGGLHYTRFEPLLKREIQHHGYKRFGSQTISWAGTRLAQMGLLIKDNGMWSATPAGMKCDLTLAEARSFVQRKAQEERDRRLRRRLKLTHLPIPDRALCG